MLQSKKIVFSGIQPSGAITIGNYFGAIKNWVKLQDEYQSIFSIVDLHAITNPDTVARLRDSILNVAAVYIAAGLQVDKVTIFQQSRVSEHAELAWILATQTQLGWLNRMTQFKDKTGDNEKNASLGLYSYPVLMAADILLYRADLVPVGEDQVQHIELTRDIAGAFNRRFGNFEHFKLPKAMMNLSTKRIMSLRDASKKMSKSDSSDASRINLSDSDDVIAHKIARAKTDSLSGIWFDEVKRPEISNLIKILAACLDCPCAEISSQIADYSASHFKQELTNALIAEIAPIRKEVSYLLNHKDALIEILSEGSKKAKVIACESLKYVYQVIGLSIC